MSIALDKSTVVIDEGAIMSNKTGFVCRKCVRSFESFKAAKEKLVQRAHNALQLFPSTPKAVGSGSGLGQRRSLEEGEHGHEITIPAKRAHTAQNPTVRSSPSVQVING